MKRKLLSVSLLTAAAAILVLGACKGGDKPKPTPTPTPSESTQSVPGSESQPSVPGSDESPVSTPESTPESTSESTEPDPVITDPTLTLSSEEDITVVAGEEVALPTFSAEDYDGTDLTAAVEIEDSLDTGTILRGGEAFLSKIAGTHVVSYYVESPETGCFVEKYIDIVVTPVNPENFDVEGYNDPAALAQYGTFKENFAAAKKNKLGVGDGNGAVSYSATADAIAGNSLIIDANKTAGSAAYQVFFSAFSDHFKRGIQANYTLEFDYKFIAHAGNVGDVYASLSWDNFDGNNVNGLIGDGELHHFSKTWTQVAVPETGNAWFSIWKYGVNAEDVIMAVDNFVVTAEECPQVSNYAPTAEELEAEGGFTWNFVDKAFTSTNGEVVIVNNIKTPAIKTALAGSDAFSANALHLTGTDDHKIGAFNADNLVAGKILRLEFTYYCVNDGGFHLIMMQPGGFTLDSYVTRTDLGDGFKSVVLEYKLPNGAQQLNIYGAGNNAFDIYVGNVNAKLIEPEPVIVTDEPPVLLENFYGPDGGNNEVHSWDGNTRTFTVTDGGDATLWFSIGANTILEAGKNYILSFNLTFAEGYVGDGAFLRYGGTFNRLPGDVSAGAHKYSVNYAAVGESFWGLYLNGNPRGSVVVSSITIEEDHAYTLTDFYGPDGGQTDAHRWDGSARTFSMNGSGNDATLWFSTNAGEFLEAGKTYVVEFDLTLSEGFVGGPFLRYDSSAFNPIDASGAGVHHVKMTEEISGVGFWGLYFNGNPNGVATVSALRITEAKEDLYHQEVVNFYGPDGGNSDAHSWDGNSRTFTVDGSGNDATLWISTNASTILEAGKKYVIEFEIDAEMVAAARIYFRFDSSAFDQFATLPAGASHGVFKVTKEAQGNGFWGFYVNDAPNGSMTISNLKITEVQ